MRLVERLQTWEGIEGERERERERELSRSLNRDH